MGYWERLDEEKSGPCAICCGWIGLALLMGAAMVAEMIADAIRLVARLL